MAAVRAVREEMGYVCRVLPVTVEMGRRATMGLGGEVEVGGKGGGRGGEGKGEEGKERGKEREEREKEEGGETRRGSDTKSDMKSASLC